MIFYVLGIGAVITAARIIAVSSGLMYGAKVVQKNINNKSK
jgi:hypothetical protein